MKSAYDVIQKVLLTEKGIRLSEEQNKYCFKVARDANKIEIKRAVEQLFSVKVTSVNTLNRKGKMKRERTPNKGRTAAIKKAIVTLQEGQSIELI
jgi:large subunit ribosomal protein L23